MTAPVRSKLPVSNNEFQVNEDPEKLDQFYVRVLGKEGDRMLTEEVKWLAVTHKSFDHGRRGYNDRLAFFGRDYRVRTWDQVLILDVQTGRRIVNFQLSLGLMHGSITTPPAVKPDKFGRTPFQHPALEGLAGLTEEAKDVITEKKRLAQLIERYGLTNVLRWKPKKVSCFSRVKGDKTKC